VTVPALTVVTTPVIGIPVDIDAGICAGKIQFHLLSPHIVEILAGLEGQSGMC
jgi:hypothetical protein